MPSDIHSDSPSDFTSDLRSTRPDIRLRDFYCVKCRKHPEMLEHTGVHKSIEGGSKLSGEGVILARLMCHGEIEQIAIGFTEAAGFLARGEKLPVFDSHKRWEQKTILGPDGRLADGR